jgi:hypothetical protein
MVARIDAVEMREARDDAELQVVESVLDGLVTRVVDAQRHQDELAALRTALASTSALAGYEILDQSAWQATASQCSARTCAVPVVSKMNLTKYFSKSESAHHCRVCGKTFCDACAPKRTGVPVRVRCREYESGRTGGDEWRIEKKEVRVCQQCWSAPPPALPSTAPAVVSASVQPVPSVTASATAAGLSARTQTRAQSVSVSRGRGGSEGGGSTATTTAAVAGMRRGSEIRVNS